MISKNELFHLFKLPSPYLRFFRPPQAPLGRPVNVFGSILGSSWGPCLAPLRLLRASREAPWRGPNATTFSVSISMSFRTSTYINFDAFGARWHLKMVWDDFCKQRYLQMKLQMFNFAIKTYVVVDYFEKMTFPFVQTSQPLRSLL